MADIFSKEKRHEVMSKIRGKDTKIEVLVRNWLYNHGIRYRKNCKGITGKPDIAIKKYKIAIFIHGCFWHGHENCRNFRLPKTNTEFWKAKIEKNIERDTINCTYLRNAGWHVFVLWECQLESNFDETINYLHKEILEIKKLHYLKPHVP